jgi:hypothetical protein
MRGGRSARGGGEPWTLAHAIVCRLARAEKIIEPIQSRCAILRYTRLSDSQLLRRLTEVCEAEGVGASHRALLLPAEGDRRKGSPRLEWHGLVRAGSRAAVGGGTHPQGLMLAAGFAGGPDRFRIGGYHLHGARRHAPGIPTASVDWNRPPPGPSFCHVRLLTLQFSPPPGGCRQSTTFNPPSKGLVRSLRRTCSRYLPCTTTQLALSPPHSHLLGCGAGL